MFHNLTLSNLEIKKLIIYKAVEFWTSFPYNTTPNNYITLAHVPVLTLHKTSQGWNNLNIDGIAKKEIIAAGGVIRCDQGNCILGFTKFTGKGSCLMAETWGLYIGLQIAASIKISSLHVEIDNHELFALINSMQFNNHPFLCFSLNAFTSFPTLMLSESLL